MTVRQIGSSFEINHRPSTRFNSRRRLLDAALGSGASVEVMFWFTNTSATAESSDDDTTELADTVALEVIPRSFAAGAMDSAPNAL